MSSVAEILTYAEQHGIQLSVNGDKLKVNGKYTPDFLETAKQHKPDLIVLLLIKEACQGLPITPEQLYALTSGEDREDIRTGQSPIEHLSWYAESLAKGIKSGRIKFHPTTGRLLKHN